MSLTHQFAFLGGHTCIDFVNTVAWRDDAAQTHDWIVDAGALREWAHQAGVLVSRGRQHSTAKSEQRALGRALRLREHLYGIFVAVSEGRPPGQVGLDGVALEVARSGRHLRLVAEGTRLRWDWRPGMRDLDQLVTVLAKSADDLLTSEQLVGVKRCAGHGCGWLFLDTSKNHSRRWCDMRICGNRVKSHRYYHAHS